MAEERSATVRFLGSAVVSAAVLAIAMLTIATALSTAGTLPPPDTRCLGEQADVIGTPGADVLGGTPRSDVIVGLGGDDQLFGLGGDDLICGGDGVDALEGDQGADTLAGGDQGDYLTGGPGEDGVVGEGGNDFLEEPSNDKAPNVLAGGSEDDQLFGGSAQDKLLGHAGADKLFGEGSRDTIKGGGEADRAEGGDGNDVIDGGAGDDVLLGGDDRDEILGGGDDDTIDGGPGADGDVRRGLWGGAGIDWILGGGGNDYIVGEADGDLLNGDAGADELFGKENDDRCEGGPGRDMCDGGEPSPKQKSQDPDICADDVERKRSCRAEELEWTGTASGTAIYRGGVREEFTATYLMSRTGKNVYTGDGTVTWKLSGTDEGGCTHEGSGSAPIFAMLVLDPRYDGYYHSLTNPRIPEHSWQGTCPDGSTVGGSFRPLDWDNTERGNYGGVETSDLLEGPHQPYQPGQTSLAGSRTYTADANTSDPEDISWQWSLTASPESK